MHNPPALVHCVSEGARKISGRSTHLRTPDNPVSATTTPSPDSVDTEREGESGRNLWQKLVAQGVEERQLVIEEEREMDVLKRNPSRRRRWMREKRPVAQ